MDQIESAFLNGDKKTVSTSLPSKLVSKLLRSRLDCDTNIIVINDKQIYYSERLLKILISKICSNLVRNYGDNCTYFKGEHGYLNLTYKENRTVFSFDVSFSQTCHYQGSGTISEGFTPDSNTSMNPKLTVITSDFIVVL